MSQALAEHQYVPGLGPLGCKIMIVGESPSDVEVQTGKPFTGPSGKELDRLLKDSGIERQNCWVSNVCKYYVPPSPRDGKPIPFQVRAERHGISLHGQIEDLQNEINAVEPNIIIALGGTALWALTGKNKITNYRGSLLRGMGRKILPTYHPAHLLHQARGEFKGYWNRQVMIFDLKRALRESQSSILELPQRTLRVCKNSEQLSDFFKRNERYQIPALDIEALDCIPTCLGIAFTPHEGLSVPLWNVRGISTIPDSDLVNIWILLSKKLAELDVIGQNMKYDQDKIRRLGIVYRRLVSDTMLKAFAINPELPKSLAFNTSIYTREPYYKDEGANFDPSKQSIDDLFIYNARDACVTKEIDLAMDADLDEIGMRDYYEKFIMLLHEMYLEIENEGFCVNEVRRKELMRKYIRWSEELAFELYTLVGGELNVNSPKQVHSLLYNIYKLGKPDGFTDEDDSGGTGEEIITGLLNRQTKPVVGDKRRVLEAILEKRRVDKTIGNNLMALPDFDGKMRTTYYLCLETGRTSTGQQDPPIRPLLDLKTGQFVGSSKKGSKYKALGTAFQVMTKHGDIGQDVRSMYEPEPGYVLLQADSSQAEARVVFLLANDEKALEDIDIHDYHALTASWFFGGTEDDYSKRVLGYEHPIRFGGKTLRHAGHLGAGKRRAATELNTQARKYKIYVSKEEKKLLTITEAMADKALKIFHLKQPSIQRVFHAEVIKCLEKARTLRAPVPYGIDAELGPPRTFFERWGDELFRQAFSYIPQRAVSDNTKGAGLRIKARIPWVRIILEAHDALLFAVPQLRLQEAAPIIKEEMERPIFFNNCSIPRRNLIIPCELELGYDYENLDKFRFERAA